MAYCLIFQRKWGGGLDHSPKIKTKVDFIVSMIGNLSAIHYVGI